jgi:hypothetical protein
MEKKIHSESADALHTMGQSAGKKVQDDFVNEVPSKIAGLSDINTQATSMTGTEKLRNQFDELTLNPKTY